ncbi:hypothetical protein K439DRAFT_923342 [Ramaria rubella]|nr:hypothetical protein K439DRAFT_923342 [Ramaria rubella]
MPLFGHSQTAAPEPENHNDHRRSLPGFSRNRNSSSPSPEGSPKRSGSILSRFHENSHDSTPTFAPDPAIKAARQKVTDAENAEKGADKALELARRAVREARQHVKDLEAAALEEARRARAKQKEAKNIRKGADRLGRHDHT